MSMDIGGEYRIPAPRQRVWDALNDPEVLKACIAGCRQLERVSDTEFSAIVATRVGPVSTTFRGTVTLTNLEPPNRYTLTGQGQGGAAGFAKMSADVSLEADAESTLLKYRAQAEIGGKLASVGSRLVQAVAKKNADDFFAAFAARLGGQGAQGAEAAPAANQGAPQGEAPPAAPQPSRHRPEPGMSPGPAAANAGGLGAPVPAWMVLFGSALGIALGYCAGLLKILH